MSDHAHCWLVIYIMLKSRKFIISMRSLEFGSMIITWNCKVGRIIHSNMKTGMLNEIRDAEHGPCGRQTLRRRRKLGTREEWRRPAASPLRDANLSRSRRAAEICGGKILLFSVIIGEAWMSTRNHHHHQPPQMMMSLGWSKFQGRCRTFKTFKIIYYAFYT